MMGAVDDGVVHDGEIRHVEDVAERTLDLVGDLALDMDAVGKGEMERNRLRRGPDLDRDAVIAHEQAKLLDQIGAAERRLRHRRRIDAGAGDVAVGEARIDPRVAGRLDQDFGIGRPHPPGQVLVLEKLGELVAEECRVGVVDELEAGDRRLGIVEALGRDPPWRHQGVGIGLHRVDHEVNAECRLPPSPGQAATSPLRHGRNRPVGSDHRLI